MEILTYEGLNIDVSEGSCDLDHHRHHHLVTPIEGVGSSEMSVSFYQRTWRNIIGHTLTLIHVSKTILGC
jgi:hypothetical protein